jgi:MFS family permease
MGVVLVGLLVIGLALPVPAAACKRRGGACDGSQFAASLVSRIWAGHYADRKGAKCGLVAGLFAAAASGLLYLLSLAFVSSPDASVSVLLPGRAVLGGSESFIITGAVSWGLALAGPQGAGCVIAWVGTAMFAALAIGAPAGTALYTVAGFGAVALGTAQSARNPAACYRVPAVARRRRRPGLNSGALRSRLDPGHWGRAQQHRIRCDPRLRVFAVCATWMALSDG